MHRGGLASTSRAGAARPVGVMGSSKSRCIFSLTYTCLVRYVGANATIGRLFPCAIGGKSIADVLAMTVEEACDFFRNIPRLARKLQTLVDVGLGYMDLGQPATTLSGGEAQRVRVGYGAFTPE